MADELPTLKDLSRVYYVEEFVDYPYSSRRGDRHLFWNESDCKDFIESRKKFGETWTWYQVKITGYPDSLRTRLEAKKKKLDEYFEHDVDWLEDHDQDVSRLEGAVAELEEVLKEK